MKLSLPTRIPVSYLASFTAALFLVEVMEGTPIWIALCAQAFLLVAGFGFNYCGGLVYPSGAFIFFNAVLSAGLGIVLKAISAEPLQTNLITPQKTMVVYLVGMCSIVAAAYASTRLRRKRGFLEAVDLNQRLTATGFGCLFISVVPPFFLPASLQGTFGQFNSAFLSVTILLVVFHVTKASGGRRSFHIVAFVSWFYLTGFYGIIHFSKQGLFGPTLAWIVAAVAGGYRTSVLRAGAVTALMIVAAMFLTPYSQLARNYNGRDDATEQALKLLLHPIQTRETYNEQARLSYEVGSDYHWFDKPQGLLDRLTMVPIDDALIASTDNGRAGTPYALWTYVLNIIPKVFYPDKPLWRWGNLYAHDIGILADTDESTGISFTPTADGYHTAQWLGITLYQGVLTFVMLFVCDSVGGSVARSPWSLMYVLYFAHAAPEGMLAVTTYTISNFTASIIAAALITKYLAPIIGTFVMPDRQLSAGETLRPYNRLST